MRYEDIGKYKAEILRDKLLLKDPNRNISAIVEHVVYGDLDAVSQLMDNLDLLICTVENPRVTDFSLFWSDNQYVLKLVNWSQKLNKLLIIMELDDLEVSTHSLLPTGNQRDFRNFVKEQERTILQRTTKNDYSLKFPCLAIHCIYWAKMKFSNFFDKIHDELRDFMHDYATFFQKLRWQFEKQESIADPIEGSLSAQNKRGSKVSDSTDHIHEAVQSKLLKSSTGSDYKTDKESRDWTRYILQTIKEIYVNKSLQNFADCVDMAINLFMDFFHVKILEQLSEYPEDLVTEDGKPFWNNIRRLPEPMSINTILHGDLNIIFVRSISILLCRLFGFEIPAPEVAIEIISNKIQNSVNELDDVALQMSDEDFLYSIDKLQDSIKSLQHIPQINLNPINMSDSSQNYNYT